MISMDLDWSKAIKNINGGVWGFRAKLKANRLNIVQATTAIREKLIPEIELKLQYANPSYDECKKWDKLLRDASLHAWVRGCALTLNKDAFHLLTRVPALHLHARVVRATELAVRLTSSSSLSSTLAVETVDSLRLPTSKGAAHDAGLEEADRNPHPVVFLDGICADRLCRIKGALADMRCLGISFSKHDEHRPAEPLRPPSSTPPADFGRIGAADTLWREAEGVGAPVRKFDVANPHQVFSTSARLGPVVTFTDGSTCPGGEVNSGWSAVFMRKGEKGLPDPVDVVKHGGGVRFTGNNYMQSAWLSLRL